MANKFYTDLLAANSSLIAAYQKMISESTQSEEDESDNIHKGWRERVQAAHPGKNLVFRSSNKGGDLMISAEEHGDKTRKAYGLYNMNTNEGHIFHDDLHEDSLFRGVPDSITHFGKKFGTLAFDTPEDANKFMSTPEGSEYGYLATVDNKHHLAKMSDEGSAV